MTATARTSGRRAIASANTLAWGIGTLSITLSVATTRTSYPALSRS
jgi:hypothetical protein